MKNTISCCDPDFSSSNACLTLAETKRFCLWRVFGNGRRLAWLMLNPSIANATENGNTVKRCIAIAKHNGYTGIEIVNLFPPVSTDPAALESYDGSDDDEQNCAHIARTVARMEVVLAFGDLNRQDARQQAALRSVRGIIGDRQVLCIARNKSGYPKHPQSGRLRVPARPI